MIIGHSYTGVEALVVKVIDEKISKRALVLGGGGAVGNAWLIGIITGLFEAGVDVTTADLIIGTSAGSTSGAQITCSTPTQLFADILSAAVTMQQARSLESSASVPRRTTAEGHLERTNKIIASAENVVDMRRKVGASALDMEGATDYSMQTQWRNTVAARLPSQIWPKRPLLISAVNACTGETVVFDRHSGVELVDAVAASCAGGFAYRIGGNQYIDGGYRADVNADLAAGYGRVLIIPPLGNKTRKQLEWGLHVEAQAKELVANGSKVITIYPDLTSQNAMGIGMGLLDLSARRPSAQAGYDQGKTLALQMAEFWN